MSLTEIKMEETKQLIIKEALDMFYWNGIIDTKIPDIAKRCRVGTASIYRYFGTKSGLVLKTSELLWQHMKQAVDNNASTYQYVDKTGIEQVEHCMTVYQNIYSSHSQYYCYHYEFNKYISSHDVTPEERSVLSQRRIFMKKYIVEAIEKGKADGSIRADVNTKDAFRVISSFMIGIAEKIALFEKGQPNTQSTINDILACEDMVLYYLRRQ